MKKKKEITREYSETDAFDLVNKYGTYEVQDTADTDNLFPTIAQGLPNDNIKKGKEKRYN